MGLWKSLCIVGIFFLSGYSNLFGQCSTPKIEAINRMVPYGDYYVIINNIQPGTYYFEYGPPGFTPGTGATAGTGGSIHPFNPFYAVNWVFFTTTTQTYDCYLRLYCNNTSWTANSAVHTYTTGGANMPFMVPGPELGINKSTSLNESFYGPGIMQACWPYGFGSELRFKFESPDTNIYRFELTTSSSLPFPEIGLKTLSSVPGAYVCQIMSSSSVNTTIQTAVYHVGPLNKGVTYDFLLDANTTSTQSVIMALKCPRPENIIVSDITPSSLRFSWTNPSSDSILVEYGPTGYTPGTGNTGGAGAIGVTNISSSPYILSGLNAFTEYDVYFRSVCGGFYSLNNKVSTKTAKDCDQLMTVNADLLTFQYKGNLAKKGAWNLTGCGTTDVSEEVIYSFTPTVSGPYELFVYSLTSNWTGYIFRANYYLKEASIGCNETGWICKGNSSSTAPAFSPHSINLGQLTAGITYFIACDGNSFPSAYSYTYRFQLRNPNICHAPTLTSPYNLTTNSATIGLQCNPCITNGIIEYGPAGFAPGTGSTAGANGTVITGVTFPYVLSGLSNSISYDVYARSDCSTGGLGYSSNAGPVSITLCNTQPASIVTNTGSDIICSGDSITLWPAGGVPASGGQYYWYAGFCGGTFIGTGDSIRVSPGQTTNYFVRIESACGITNCAYKNIQVMNLGISGNTNICPGQTSTLNATFGWSSYLWSGGQTTYSIQVSSPGTYYVTATSANGCQRTDSITVNQYTPPAPQISGNTTLCTGISTTLSAGNYQSYQWSTGATTPSITVSSAGTYSVTVSDQNGCTGSDAVNVNIMPPPVVSISSSGQVCQGQTVILNASSGLASYLWSTGETSSSILVTSAGTYSVTGTSSQGCQNSDSITVAFYPAPQVQISGITDICTGNSTVLNAGNYSSYLWNSGATTSSIQVNSSGTYTVTVTDPNGCSGYDSVMVTVHPIPVVTIGYTGSNVICQGDSVMLFSNQISTGNQWYLRNQPIAGATSPVYYAKSRGNYHCRYTDQFGCTGISTTIQVKIICHQTGPNIFKDTEAISGPGQVEMMHVFPNPGNGLITLQSEKGMLEIYSMKGELVFSKSLQENENLINLSEQENGIYLLRLITNKGILTSRYHLIK